MPPSRIDPLPLYLAVRLAVFYGGYFLVGGVLFPFWPLLLEARGMAAGQIGLLLALALWRRAAAGPLVAWQADRSGAPKKPLIACALVALAVIALAVTGIVHEWVRGTRSRHRKGESYPVAWARLMGANRPRYGGYVVHLAIAMLAVGVIGSTFYDVQRDFTLNPGEAATLDGYTFRYVGFNEAVHPDREEVTARFEVHDGDTYLGVMNARRTFYSNFRIAATRAAIRSTPLEDFYIVPSEFSDGGRAVFRVYINPLVWWMWASGALFLAGTLLAVSPRRRPAPMAVRLPGRAQVAGA